MAFEVGEPVDRFIVEAHLGDGGLASVYLVRHRRLGAVSALKVLTSTDEQLRHRLLQEGRIQSTLRHDNIVSVLDVIDIDHKLALQMDYVAGPPLDTLLANHRPSLDESLALFGAICSGIAAAHEQGLVHRDLKPANVLLHIADHGVVPKVCDFGIAKAPADGDVSMTRPGQAMGTPAYMAPEQVHATGDVDPRADVFSLGAVLYELVCGQRAFQGENMLAVLNAVYTSNYTDPLELSPNLPAPVVSAITAALHQNRDDRPADVRELARILYGVAPDVDPLPDLPRHVGRDTQLFDAAKALKLRTPPPAPQRDITDTMNTRPPTADAAVTTFGGTTGQRGLMLAVALGFAIAIAWGAFVGYAIGTPGDVELPPLDGADELPDPTDGPEPLELPEQSTVELEPSDDTGAPAQDPEQGADSAEPTRNLAHPDGEADPDAEPEDADEPLVDVPSPDERPKKRHWPKVSVDGLSERTILKAGVEEFELPNKVPPGTWEVFVWFDGEPAQAGTVTLVQDVDAVLLCSVVDRRCAVK